MRRRTSPVGSLVIAVATLLTAGTLLTTGCGIAGEPTPREVAPPPGYEQLLEQPPTPAPAEPGDAIVTIYFTRDGAPFPVERSMLGNPSLRALMRSLHLGPTEAEQSQGIISVLPGANITDQVELEGGQARVELTVSPDGTSRNDINLAFAQVVCTLDARPEVSGVFFVVQGEPVAVPTGDASALDSGPVTAADYGCAKPAE